VTAEVVLVVAVVAAPAALLFLWALHGLAG
jgi:hypothetical protein